MAIRLLRDRSPQQHDFPWMMYEILETAAKRNEEHVVSWVDDGKGFKIHNRELFVERYMKKMTKMSKYKSFQRQVNFWGFESRYRDRGMKNQGSYYHNDFVRGQPHRLEALKRVPPASSRKKEWNRMYQRLLDHVGKYHTSHVPLNYNEDREFALWVQEQRTLNIRVPRHFTREIERLRKLPGWTWTSEEEADTAKVLASLGNVGRTNDIPESLASVTSTSQPDQWNRRVLKECINRNKTGDATRNKELTFIQIDCIRN